MLRLASAAAGCIANLPRNHRQAKLELGGGRIGYSLKKRWQDGTAAVVMTQEVLMERLCELVLRPRKHLVTYHGVLAPASGLRSRVVPLREGDVGVAGGCRHGDGDGAAAVASANLAEAVVAAGVDLGRRLAERQRRQRLRVLHGGGRRSGGRRRLSWASLLRRVLAAIRDPAMIP